VSARAQDISAPGLQDPTGAQGVSASRGDGAAAIAAIDGYGIFEVS